MVEIEVLDTAAQQIKKGWVLPADRKDMPAKNREWNFSWKQLFQIEGSEHFKVILNDSPKEIEGLLMTTLMNDEMLVMNNIEVAPHNYGSTGKYERVAGVLIAFACVRSFELGANSYKGFLSFDSKTALIPLYKKKYGATHAFGHKMFFDPNAGRKLISEYLGITF